MKSFLSKNKKLLAISLIGFFIFSSGVAFAYTSQDWLTKATVWANANCTNPTSAGNQRSFVCYLWSKSAEQQTAINNLNTANNTKTTQISDLQGKAKNIWVYDKNNNKLGIYSDGAESAELTNAVSRMGLWYKYFYDVLSNKFVRIAPDGKTALPTSIAYASSDCTGQAYYIGPSEAAFFESTDKLLRNNVNSTFFAFTDYNASATYEIARYLFDWSGNCVFGGGGYYGTPVTQVYPSFPSQVTFPLIFKYE